jgi:hypothetical protein
MPSLEQVMTAFPERDFFIDVKSNDAAEGELLAERLTELTANREGEITVFGGPRPVGLVRERLPHIRTITRPRLKRCLTRYLAVGWSGYVPSDCRQSVLFVPANVAPWLWGWPNRLLRRMDRVGTRVVLIGDYSGEGFSTGFDDPDRLTELPWDYSGVIWTDRIDLIGPAVRGSADRWSATWPLERRAAIRRDSTSALAGQLCQLVPRDRGCSTQRDEDHLHGLRAFDPSRPDEHVDLRAAWQRRQLCIRYR